MKLKLLGTPRVRVRLAKKATPVVEPTIQRMEFLKSDYDSADAVKAAIEKHEFDIGKNKIVEQDDRFVVTDESDLTKFESVAEIGGPEEGFNLFGGTLKKGKKPRKRKAKKARKKAKKAAKMKARKKAPATVKKAAKKEPKKVLAKKALAKKKGKPKAKRKAQRKPLPQRSLPQSRLPSLLLS